MGHPPWFRKNPQVQMTGSVTGVYRPRVPVTDLLLGKQDEFARDLGLFEELVGAGGFAEG